MGFNLQFSNLRGDWSLLVMVERDLWLRIAFNHVGSRRYVDEFAVNAHDEARARPWLPLRRFGRDLDDGGTKFFTPP